MGRVVCQGADHSGILAFKLARYVSDKNYMVREQGVQKKQLVFIAGPTAVGKTALTVQLARHYQTEIVSADSRQIYREMTIGTAKPSMAERGGVLHHFINSSSIHDVFTAADYEREALDTVNTIFQKQDVAFVAGGTGLYMRALMNGFDIIPDVDEAISAAVENDYQQFGLAGLQQELRTKDPVYYAKVDTQNPHRLMRAIGVIRQYDRPFSSYLTQQAKARPFDTIPICLTRPRELLYDRINRRVDIMMDMGLLDEVRDLLTFRHLRPLQTVGYAELFDYLEGKHSLERAVELIKQNSRRYAKRQLTWFRNQGDWTFVDVQEDEQPAQKIIQLIEDA